MDKEDEGDLSASGREARKMRTGGRLRIFRCCAVEVIMPAEKHSLKGMRGRGLKRGKPTANIGIGSDEQRRFSQLRRGCRSREAD